VFLALFYMLRKELKLKICGTEMAQHAQAAHQSLDHFASQANNHCDLFRHGSAKFLFIPDITFHAVGAVLVVLIVLYVGSQLASSLLMSVTADRNQRLMMIGLPFLFTIFILNFPAGLIVYWITTNCWTIVQQFIVRRTAPPPPPVPATTPAEPGTGGGGLLARLSAAAGGKTAEAPAAAATTRPPPSPRKKKKRSGRRR
jgi:YidC/Oxa1 family membrane protein insertase